MLLRGAVAQFRMPNASRLRLALPAPTHWHPQISSFGQQQQHRLQPVCHASNSTTKERSMQQKAGIVKHKKASQRQVPHEVPHASLAASSAEHREEDMHQPSWQHKQHPTSDSAAWTIEVYKLGKLAVPLLLQYIIANSSHLINTSFVGHLSDPVMLSAMVMATSLSMATGYSIMSGIASVSETLCGQAFGAENYTALQETLQRALLIVGMTCVPVTLIWSHAEQILLMLGQPAGIAEGAARYLVLTLPALYLYCIHECVDKYLLSQRVVKPSLFITAATTALTPLLAWLFVVKQEMGLEGAAYAYVAVQACTTTLSLSYLAYREGVQLPKDEPAGWTPFKPSFGALANWGPYVALAVPAVMSYCMEGWATEVLIFLSGMLDNADVAVGVTGLALQFSTLVWLAAASIGSAASTRVANMLGRGDAAGAQRTAQTATLSVLASQATIGITAFTFREPLLHLMTNNSDVINLALATMPVLACCFIADGLNAVQGAVLRGAGRQWWTAGLNILGWWGVGVPLAYYLSIVQGGNVPGLWTGFAIASCIQSCMQFLAISKFVDWEEEVRRAKAMMSGPPPESSDDEDMSGGGSGGSSTGPSWSGNEKAVDIDAELVGAGAKARSSEFSALQKQSGEFVVLKPTLPPTTQQVVPSGTEELQQQSSTPHLLLGLQSELRQVSASMQAGTRRHQQAVSRLRHRLAGLLPSAQSSHR